MSKIIPKFNIDDIVQMNDEHHFNPCSKTVSIGKIKAIHIHKKLRKKGYLLGEDSRITYSITGFSLMPKEEELKLYSKEGIVYE